MHASYNIILGLIALSAAKPTPLLGNDINMDIRSESDPQWPEVMNQIQQAFVQACHNTCMKLFPDEGIYHDNCMNICR
ncbi:uncharacterized protein GGS22DRAFT_176765, partial [Annulohypoxylon maeteangense]|uniref:uncharacterized protein n=1 Tax=Annulohypoxylon maeteangense TaxID=1927788 RepID=UPI0020087105